jgi:hypothetical protein
MDYEKLYKILFNGITDALDVFEKGGCERVCETLMRAQQAAEEYYIESQDDDEDAPAMPLYVLPHDKYTNI